MNILCGKLSLKTAVSLLFFTCISTQSFGDTSVSYDDMEDPDAVSNYIDNLYFGLSYNNVLSSNIVNNVKVGKDDNILTSSKSNGHGGSVSVGYKYNNLRFELEGSFLSLAHTINVTNPVIHAAFKGVLASLKDASKIEFFTGVLGGSVPDLKTKIISSTVKEAKRGVKYTIPTKDSANAITAMVSAYYDFENDSDFIPYVGIGGGLVSNKFMSDTYNHSLGAQGKIGLNYKITDNSHIFAGYKGIISFSKNATVTHAVSKKMYYREDNKGGNGVAFDISSNDDIVVNINSRFFAHTLEVGLRYSF